MNVKSRKTGKPPAPAENRRPYRSTVRAEAADATRARIIDAARTLFIGGKDLPAFSVDGVARQAGVTRLTVYNRFESKLGLLEAVFDDIAERGGLFSELPAAFAEPDPRTALRRFVSVFCRFWTRHGAMMPAFHAASISTKMIKELAGATLIGPIVVGLSHSVQICTFGATDADIVNMAALAAYGAGKD